MESRRVGGVEKTREERDRPRRLKGGKHTKKSRVVPIKKEKKGGEIPKKNKGIKAHQGWTDFQEYTLSDEETMLARRTVPATPVLIAVLLSLPCSRWQIPFLLR